MVALEPHGTSLGYPLRDVDDTWCLAVALSERQIIPVAFSRPQAIEIARRIWRHYGEPEPRISGRHFRWPQGGV